MHSLHDHLDRVKGPRSVRRPAAHDLIVVRGGEHVPPAPHEGWCLEELRVGGVRVPLPLGPLGHGPGTIVPRGFTIRIRPCPRPRYFAGVEDVDSFELDSAPAFVSRYFAGVEDVDSFELDPAPASARVLVGGERPS